MSAPVAIGVVVAAVALGIPVLSVGAQLEARHRAAGAADAAALAAADAASGWVAGDPCALAAQVAGAVRVELAECEVGASSARVVARAAAMGGGFEARARAGWEGAEERGRVEANGWAWPSGVRRATQGFHDGYAIDLAVSANGALYAPYDGVVVQSGADGAGVPTACTKNPSWWHGANHTVLMRHEYRGRVLFSSHNHVAPGSAVRAGARVASGQRVATAGLSGCTSGPHTHFTLSTSPANTAPDVDPYLYLGRPDL